MRKFVEFIAEQLIDNPRKLKVEEEEDGENRLVFTLHVEQKDIGKIIGKDGGNINAFRRLLRAVAAKQGKQVILKVADERPK